MANDWLDYVMFETGVGGLTVARVLTALAAMGVVGLLAWVLSRVLASRISFLDEGDRRTGGRIASGLVLVFGFLGCLDYLGVNVARPVIGGGTLTLSLLSLATSAALAVAVLFGAHLARTLTEHRLSMHTTMDQGVRYAVARVLYYIILTLGLLAALQTLGLQLSSLTVALGALSVGIGFGLQNIVNNFVSGLILLFERPIQVGDWIEVEGTRGRVTRIGARSVNIVTSDNIDILVPNGSFISNQVINWSHGDPRVRLRLPIAVAYGSHLPQVVDVLLEAAATVKEVLPEPAPSVLLDNFGDFAVNLELAIWIDTRTNNPRRVRSHLNFAVFEAFRREGVEIPFPQRDVYLRVRASASQTAAPEEP